CLDALGAGTARERINITRTALLRGPPLCRSCRVSLCGCTLGRGLSVSRRGVGLLSLGRLGASGIGCRFLRSFALVRLRLSGAWASLDFALGLAAAFAVGAAFAAGFLSAGAAPLFVALAAGAAGAFGAPGSFGASFAAGSGVAPS